MDSKLGTRRVGMERNQERGKESIASLVVVVFGFGIQIERI